MMRMTMILSKNLDKIDMIFHMVGKIKMLLILRENGGNTEKIELIKHNIFEK